MFRGHVVGDYDRNDSRNVVLVKGRVSFVDDKTLKVLTKLCFVEKELEKVET